MNEGTIDVRQAYEWSLKELRKDAGCTPDRLPDHHELADALKQRLSRKGRATTVWACLEELKTVVSCIGDEEEKEALLVALRFDPNHDGNTATERRTSYLTSLNHSDDPARRRVRCNIRTIERRENRGIEKVARLLANRVDIDTSPTSGEGGYLVTPRDSLIAERRVQTYYFSPSGSIVREEVRLWLKALSINSGRHGSGWRRYFSEGRPGVLSIQAAYGCRIVEVKEDARGGIRWEYEIFKDLTSEDEPYPCAFEIKVNSDERAEPIVRLNVEGPMQAPMYIEIHLVFDPAMAPVSAWWFQERAGTIAYFEPEPSGGRHLEVLDNGRYVYKAFELTTGISGVAWIWP